MGNYYKIEFSLNPFSNDAADLLAAFLADIDFESFEETEAGINAYIQEPNFNENLLKEVLESFPMDTDIVWKQELIKQRDWNSEWEKKYFKPLLLADGKCIIHSSFHKDYPAAEVDITIDPKMAFGTGHHATTSMMVNYLFSTPLKNEVVIDMGTGTGILAIIAKKLGAEEVWGIEIDPGAYDNALENAELNDAKVNFLLGDASKLAEVPMSDVFLANINRNIIIADLERYLERLKPGGRIFLSGFYASDIPLIKFALEGQSAEIISTSEENEGWSAIQAIKKY